MQGAKRKNKQEFSKIKNICGSKDTVKKVKGQYRKKTSANHISCKGLVFKIISQ